MESSARDVDRKRERKMTMTGKATIEKESLKEEDMAEKGERG